MVDLLNKIIFFTIKQLKLCIYKYDIIVKNTTIAMICQ